METLKREDRRVLDKAVSLMASGAKADDRLRNVLKLYMKEPSHRLGVHEWGLVRKFVNGGSAESKSRNKASEVAKAKILTSKDRADLDEALKFSSKTPPVDARLTAYLNSYSGKRTVAISEHTRSMLSKYLRLMRAPIKLVSDSKFQEGKVIGLGISSSMEMIGPEKAFSMLEMNEKIGFSNRPLSKERIGRYAYDMKAGRWRMTGEPVMLGKQGQLMNGQHRLYAIIDAEVEIPVIVIRGVDESAFSSMDQGMPRKVSDVVGMNGVKDATLTASLIRLIYRWEKFGPTMISQRRIGYGFTNEMAVEMMMARPKLGESVIEGRRSHNICQPSVIAFSHYVCAEKSRQAADEFFEKLRTGIGIGSKKGDPIYTLRQRLIAQRSSATRVMKPEAAIRMVIRMWNGWRKGESLDRIPNLLESEIQRPV